MFDSVTPWTAAHQASPTLSTSQSLLKLMSIESMMPSNHLILCHPLLLLPSVFPSIRVFFHESAVYTRWPKYWSFRFSISPSNEYSGLISLLSKGLTRVLQTSCSHLTTYEVGPMSTYQTCLLPPMLLASGSLE